MQEYLESLQTVRAESNLDWLPLTGGMHKTKPPVAGGPLLTEAQTRLLRALRAGLTIKAAATQLGISEDTAHVQLRNCRDRLGVIGNDEVVRKAVGLGLIE